jgi:hypothetical protein
VEVRYVCYGHRQFEWRIAKPRVHAASAESDDNQRDQRRVYSHINLSAASGSFYAVVPGGIGRFDSQSSRIVHRNENALAAVEFD